MTSEKKAGKLKAYRYNKYGERLDIRGADGILFSEQGSQKKYYMPNILGDVAHIKNSGQTKPATNYAYDAFGRLLTARSDADANPFLYRGEYADTETGFTYLRNRYYSSATANFLTEDPAKDGTNWYIYCGNNPVLFVDPWGLAITKEDLVAYAAGKISDKDMAILQEADAEWNNARADDYSAKAVAHMKAAAVRARYDRNYIKNDTFDYTFGTGYSVIDNGEEGTYLQTFTAHSEDGSFGAITKILYQRVVNGGRYYITLHSVSGYGFSIDRHSKRGTVEAMIGQGAIIGSETINISEKSGQFYYAPSFGKIFDDAGVGYTNVGVNANFSYNRLGKTRKIEIINHLYNTYYVDENGRNHFDAEIPYNILQGRGMGNR